MPFGSVTLIPGVNVTRTPTLLQTGFTSSQLIRFRDSLVQKYGGWDLYFSSNVAGVTRDMHAWQDLNDTTHLLLGSTTKLGVITNGSYTDITPTQLTNNVSISATFSTTQDSNVVNITDAGITGPTVYDAVMMQVPVSIGGLVLVGVYQIDEITGTNSYNIIASQNATSTTTTAFVPLFTTTAGSATVTVNLPNVDVSVGDRVTFQVSTTGDGVTISGAYVVGTVIDSDNFTITVNGQASAGLSFNMNNNQASILYYIVQGPPAAGSGYGLGPYETGGYGTGTTGSSQIGTPITATDWTSDNWGEIALACPEGGGVYQYNPNGGFAQASLVATAPAFVQGIFVSTSQQVLFCYGATSVTATGLDQDPLLISWSTVGDYTDFVPLSTNQAGSYRLSNGSIILAGMSVQNQNIILTDLDCWVANYVGVPLAYGFNKIASGAGAASSHAVQAFRGNVYWMGQSNFYSFTSDGVKVMPCPMWDFVFQNLNTAFISNVRAMPNTPFNEIGWLFPSSASTSGENDSYIKVNILEPGMPWDGGLLGRSAWIDQTILGNPISATSTGAVYQQETTEDAAGQPMSVSFTTGYFYLAEGEDFVFVDQIIPDMIWGTYAGTQTAQLSFTFNVINFPGDTPTSYGPYSFNSTTEYISVRFRGRQMSITVEGSDGGSFWRAGRVRYRWAPAGRR